MAENSDSTIDLRLRNYGQTVADDLRVSFDPPLPEVPASERLVTRFLKQRYDRTIAHLSPGQTLSTSNGPAAAAAQTLGDQSAASV